jgi:hypothetical protein
MVPVAGSSGYPLNELRIGPLHHIGTRQRLILRQLSHSGTTAAITWLLTNERDRQQKGRARQSPQTSTRRDVDYYKWCKRSVLSAAEHIALLAQIAEQ